MPRKFEKITRGLEKLATDQPASEKEAVIEYSPEEKAEQLWALYCDYSDYRRQKFEQIQELRDKSSEQYKQLKKLRKAKQKEVKKRKIDLRTERMPADLGDTYKELLEKDPTKIVLLKEEISQRWQDKKVQELFKKHLRENLEQQEEIKPTLENYREKEQELENYKMQQEETYREIFVHRGEEPDELTQLELADISARIENLDKELGEIFESNPELAAFVMKEKLDKYHKQYEDSEFMWLPSRRELYDKILENLVILNQNRPVFLVGETGTGKTRLARATAVKLTNKEAYEVGEEARDDIRPLLGTHALKDGKTYIDFGQLGQAQTGKQTSLDTKSDGGGIFYWDEMNGYPPEALRSVIKQSTGKRPGDLLAYAAWRGHKEKMAEKAAIIGSGNLPSDKHPDRAELPVEITRELSTIEVGYPEQTADNPELYEAIVAVLQDQNKRLRLRENEAGPDWEEKINSDKGIKEKKVNLDTKAGGVLWRFANLIAETQKSYIGKEKNILTDTKGDASYLRKAVFDLSDIFASLKKYRLSDQRQGRTLKEFLLEKLREWSSRQDFPEEDRKLLKDFFKEYDFDIDKKYTKKELEKEAGKQKIWSEKEIGFLSPRVPREKEEVEPEAPTVILLENGEDVEYEKTGDYISQKFVYQEKELEFIGQTEDGKIVLKNEEGIGILLESEEFQEIKKETILADINKKLNEPEFLNQKIEKFLEEIFGKDQTKEKKDARKEIKKLEVKSQKDFIIEHYRRKISY